MMPQVFEPRIEAILIPIAAAAVLWIIYILAGPMLLGRRSANPLKNITLMRPLCFVDLETTGLDTENDRIVCISIVKCYPAGHVDVFTQYVNPKKVISHRAAEVHKITNDMVRYSPTFNQVVAQVLHYLEGSDIAGFNSNNFDVPILMREIQRAGRSWDISSTCFLDVSTIFRKQHPRNLSAAYKLYCGLNLRNAHNAEADARAAMKILNEQALNIPLPLPTVKEICRYQNGGLNARKE